MKTSENIERDPDDTEPAGGGNIQMEDFYAQLYSPSIDTNGGLLCLVVQPKYWSSNKKLPVRTQVSIGTL